MPVDQIARAIQSRGDIALAEETALNNAVDGLKNVGRFEFERARDIERLDLLGIGNREVEYIVGIIHRQGFRVGIEV